MKKLFIIIVFITAITVITSRSHAETYSAQHEAVKKLFQSDAEKTTKDALWTAKDIFKVVVIDNGKLMRDGKWVKLGESQCQ